MKSAPRRWLAGFVLLGVVLGLLGSAVISWQYHIDVDSQLIGLHFLALNAGYALAAILAQQLSGQWRPRTAACMGCGVLIAGLAGLCWAFPPAPVGARIALLAVLGMGAGLLTTALLDTLWSYFSQFPALALNQAGFAVGCGGLLATLTNAACYSSDMARFETSLLAIAPAAVLWLLLSDRSGLGGQATPRFLHEPVAETLRDLRSIATVLLSLLLFFQFGNEWSMAGWLPLFVIHRLGGNPVFAICTLGVYFLALIAGRVVFQELLPAVSHWKFLVFSTIVSLSGYLLLSLAGSIWPAWMGVVLTGLGFAPIYPLVAERLDERFAYQPGFYRGTSSIAITGAMSAPWLLGFVDAHLGMRYVMLLPAAGSVIVLVLALLIVLEAHVMGRKSAQRRQSAAAGRL